MEIDEIIKRIKDNPKPPKWIDEARTDHKDWKALFLGENFKDKLIKIEHIESQKVKDNREKFAIPIKMLNNKLVKPLDYIYAAVGGSKSYTVEGKEKEKLFERLMNFRGGVSIGKWLETNWAKLLYIIDPCGVIFLEYYKQDWIKPTYKSILSIRNYKSEGQKLKWILFEPEKKKEGDVIKEYVRYVDESMDYTFLKEGNDYFIVEEKTFQHPFKEVPALTCSNIEIIGQEKKLSLFDCIKEKQEEYLRDTSFKIINKIKSIPLRYRTGIICNYCKGSGTITDTEGSHKCTHCQGRGEVMNPDVIDEIIIPVDITSNEVKIPNSIGGYLMPDTSIWNQYIKELNDSEIKMFDALWGILLEENAAEKTATEVFINIQPKINKLNEISDVAQFMEFQLTEWVARWLFPTKKENVSNINYGRIYLLETPDKILERFATNKEKGASTIVLDRIILEYLTTKYKNDPETLRVELLKKQLEPFPYYSVEQVNQIFGVEKAQKKMLFVDWWETLQLSDKDKQKEQLEKMFDKWILTFK